MSEYFYIIFIASTEKELQHLFIKEQGLKTVKNCCEQFEIYSYVFLLNLYQLYFYKTNLISFVVKFVYKC